MKEKRNKEIGQGMVELAIIFMALVLILMFIFDFGRVIYDFSVVYNAAREGARYGIIPTVYNSQAPALDTTGITNAARSRAAGLDNVTVGIGNVVPVPSINPVYYTFTVTVSSIYTPVSPIIEIFTGSQIPVSSTTKMKIEK